MREYRASSLGYSLESLVAPFLGYEALPVPDWLQVKFDEGTRLEPIVIDRLRELIPCEISYQNIGGMDGLDGEEVRLEIIPGVAVVVGHIDGRIKVTSNGPEKVLEIKSMNGKTWRDFFNNGIDSRDRLIEKYKWQISSYMLATGMPCMLVGWNKDTEEIARHTVTEPPYTISDIANRLYRVEGYIEKGEIPDGCEDFPCRYAYLHPPKEDVAKASDELDALLSQWLEADKGEKAYQTEKAQLRTSILALAGEAEKGKVKGSSGVTVSTVWNKGGVSTVTRKPGWVTTVAGPRKVKGTDGEI